MGFPCGSTGKESICNAGDLGLIPELGRSPGEEKGYPLQYSGPENSMDSIVRGVTKSRTQLRDFHFSPPWGRKQYDCPSSTDEETEACRVCCVSKTTQRAVTGKKGFQALSVF